MIKRAKKAALEFFKEIFNKPIHQTKKSKNKDKDDDGVNLDTLHHSHHVRKSLRNSLSDQNITSTSKHKRKPSHSRKNKKNKANSLPTPLNNDPAFWAELRARSRSDVSEPPLILPTPTTTTKTSSPSSTRKHKPHRARSEISLKKSQEEGMEIQRKSTLKLLNNKGVTPGEPIHVSFEVYDKTPTPTPGQDNAFVSESERLLPMLILEPGSEVKTVGENDEANKQERADRRKATSFISVKAEHEKEAKVIEAYNKEILDIWETMMARDVEEVTTRLEAEKRELLAEIAFREATLREEATKLLQLGSSDAPTPPPPKDTPTPPQTATPNGPTAQLGKKSAINGIAPPIRRGSVVAFHTEVEIREVDHEGVARSTSKAALFDKDRPRPVRKALKTSNELIPRTGPSPLPKDSSSSPSHSPLSSPLSSPAASPPVSPRTASPQAQSPLAKSATTLTSSASSVPHVSPRISPTPQAQSPLAKSTLTSSASPVPHISPRISPTPPTQSPLSKSTTSAAPPVSAPTNSPNSSPKTPQRTIVNKPQQSPQPPQPQPSPAKAKPPMRAFAKVLAGKPANSPPQNSAPPNLTNSRELDVAMEEEIAQVIERSNRDKLAILEEIELREINAVSAKCDATRRDLLEEIARRESSQTSAGASKDSPRDSPRSDSFRVKRHAVRLRKTLTQALLDPVAQKAEDERIAKEIREVNELNSYKPSEFTLRASAKKEMKKPQRTTSYSHRQLVWRKSASFRLAIRQPPGRQRSQSMIPQYAGN